MIVGSAFVRILLDHAGDEAAGLDALRDLTADLAEGCAVAEAAPLATRFLVVALFGLLAACGGGTEASVEFTGKQLDPPFEVSPTALIDTDGDPSA